MDNLRSADFIYLARIVQRTPSEEELGAVVTYEPFAIVAGSERLPDSWSTTRVCERTGDTADVGEVWVFLIDTERSADRGIIGSYWVREIYVPSLRRKVSQAMREARNR